MNQNDGKQIILDAADYKVGDTIEFSTGNPAGDPKDMKIQSAKVLGILNKGILGDQYNQSGGINIITTEDMYKKISGTKDYNTMTIVLNSNADREVVLNYLKALNGKDPSYQYSDSTESARQSRDTAVTMSIFLYGFVAVIALIGCLNIINTISTNLILRKRELSMMKAVGMTGGGVKKMIFLEGLFYGIMAAIYGSIIGTLLSFVLYKLVIRIREFEWSIPLNQIITAVLGGIAVTLISSLVPLKKINKGNIIDNIRTEE
jgi:putative ABC transport system permease protein